MIGQSVRAISSEKDVSERNGLHSTIRALVFGPEENHRLDLDHMIAVYMLDKRPAAITEGTTGTLSAGGRTVAVMSVGDWATGPFLDS
jgi:hypothetical protein